jgi:hypothetical protein
VEPENTESLPAFVKALAPEVAVIYEAHRPWRDGFGLVHVDLPAYAQQLARRVKGTRVVVAAEPGAIER